LCPSRAIGLEPKRKVSEKAFRRILVAVDGSESSLRAARLAVRLAERNEAELVAVSVVQRPAHAFMQTPVAGTPGLLMIGLDDYYRSAAKNAERWIEKVASLARSRGVRFRKRVLRGGASVDKSITDYAVSQEVDLVVVGRKGMDGFKRLLLGSVSSGVVNHAASSVLVVR
jgi:nucleotide-binding universal stress UspA family protein